MNEIYDVAVIGGGPAGYVAAIKAAMLGGKVILFEKDAVGGTCLNRGCIPTKSYVRTAEIIEEIKNACKRGIMNDSAFTVDMKKVVEYKTNVVKKLTGGVAWLLKSRGVTVVYGQAEMESETQIACCGQIFQAKNTLLCSGSVSGSIPVPGAALPGVLSSDELLELAQVPSRLCIIGGGVIGCEFAAAFSAFGSKVTIVELADSLIPMMDAELGLLMEKSFESQGIDLCIGVKVEKIERKDREFAVTADGNNIACDAVLMSVGRKADLSCLGKLKDRIALEGNFVKVDDMMRTNVKNIYAPGDLNGKSMLAHAAFKMGETAAKNALGANEVCHLQLVPSCVYTIPEVASVGLTEEIATEIFGKSGISVGKFPFAANGRALVSGNSAGMVKVIIHKKSGELLGVHMFGMNVTEMIGQPTSLMAMRATAHEILEGIIHPHPTCSEAFMEACADALGCCIHLPKKALSEEN